MFEQHGASIFDDVTEENVDQWVLKKAREEKVDWTSSGGKKKWTGRVVDVVVGWSLLL